MSILQARAFHPLYADIADLGFDFYFMQQFIGEDAKLELTLTDRRVFYKPENGGRFVDVGTYERVGMRQNINPDHMEIELNYIGIHEDRKKKQGLGTQLLRAICRLADKYNMQINLSIDTKFNTPYKVLRKWYESFGFIYIHDRNMTRFRKSERELNEVKQFPLPQTYRGVVEYALKVYELGKKDKGYPEETRKEFNESIKRLKKVLQTPFSTVTLANLSFIQLFLLHTDVDGAEGLLMDFEEPSEYKNFLQWSKGQIVTVQGESESLWS